MIHQTTDQYHSHASSVNWWSVFVVLTPEDISTPTLNIPTSANPELLVCMGFVRVIHDSSWPPTSSRNSVTLLTKWTSDFLDLISRLWHCTPQAQPWQVNCGYTTWETSYSGYHPRLPTINSKSSEIMGMVWRTNALALLPVPHRERC